MYRGENADLQQEAKQLFDEYIAPPKPMLLTATEFRSFNNATTCHICTKPLGDDKVGDHCHLKVLMFSRRLLRMVSAGI